MVVNQPLPWFSRVGQEKILYLFLEHSENHTSVWNRLTPLLVKITRSTNLLSVCRRKLKLSTYLHTKLQPHKLSQYTLAIRLSSWYFLGIAGSSGFYSITWRMISRKHAASIQRKLFSLVGVISFLSLNFYSLANRPRFPCFHTIKYKQPENLHVNCRECFGNSPSSQRPRCFNNAILHLIEIIKNAVVTWKFIFL